MGFCLNIAFPFLISTLGFACRSAKKSPVLRVSHDAKGTNSLEGGGRSRASSTRSGESPVPTARHRKVQTYVGCQFRHRWLRRVFLCSYRGMMQVTVASDVCKGINKQKQDANASWKTSRAFPYTAFADGHHFLPGTGLRQKKVGKGERERRQP